MTPISVRMNPRAGMEAGPYEIYGHLLTCSICIFQLFFCKEILNSPSKSIDIYCWHMRTQQYQPFLKNRKSVNNPLIRLKRFLQRDELKLEEQGALP